MANEMSAIAQRLEEAEKAKRTLQMDLDSIVSQNSL